MTARRPLRTAAAGLLVVLVAASPVLFGADSYLLKIASMAAVYLLLATAYDLLLGLSGLFLFSPTLFFGVGAYACALLLKHHELPLLAGIALATVGGGLVGVVKGLTLQRFSGRYLALVSVALVMILESLAVTLRSVTGGTDGLYGFSARPLLPFTEVTYSPESRYLFIAAIAVVGLAAQHAFRSSGVGRGLVAVGADEVLARSSAIPVFRYRLLAFVVAGLLGGAAGGLQAVSTGLVSPHDLSLEIAVTLLLIIVIGGPSRMWWVAAAAIGMTVLPEYLTVFDRWRFVVYGVLITVFVWMNPRGLAGAADDVVDRLRGPRLPRPPRPGSPTGPAVAVPHDDVHARAGS